VPGGTGPVTALMLARNTISAAFAGWAARWTMSCSSFPRRWSPILVSPDWTV
jgi:hypothetical protein